jgi:ER lumen protein retaining receptor
MADGAAKAALRGGAAATSAPALSGVATVPKAALRGAKSGVPGQMSEARAKQLAAITSHSWNVFRYIGDYLHLFGVFVLLATLFKNQSCQGISRSTQFLYFCVFITRYLDLIDHSQTAYLVFFKLTYILTSIIVLFIFWKFDSTYERQKDTCNLAILFVPCITASVLLANEISVLEMLWTFSQFMEGFAMVPQYIFCYRDRGARDFGVTLYVFCLGGYRVFYACNWIYKKVMMPHYFDMHSWIGGVIEISFFIDYLLSRFTNFSLLRSMVLKVDEKINEFQGQVELKVLGSSRMRKAVDAEAGTELRRRKVAEDSKAPEEV